MSSSEEEIGCSQCGDPTIMGSEFCPLCETYFAESLQEDCPVVVMKISWRRLESAPCVIMLWIE